MPMTETLSHTGMIENITGILCTLGNPTFKTQESRQELYTLPFKSEKDNNNVADYQLDFFRNLFVIESLFKSALASHFT